MRGIILGDMKKLRKMKKNIDKGLPAFGKLLDDAVDDLPKKADSLINSSLEGLKKYFLLHLQNKIKNAKRTVNNVGSALASSSDLWFAGELPIASLCEHPLLL